MRGFFNTVSASSFPGHSIVLLLFALPVTSHHAQRTVPPIPPADRPIEVLVDADAKNEVARAHTPENPLWLVIHRWIRSTKGMFDLGDIAAVVNPSIGTWEVGGALCE